MQTMSVLVRVAGDLNMTVKVHNITPAEAILLAHIHDAATKDVFEGAEQTDNVERTNVEERERLQAKYPEAKKLIDQLFPGRNAADIPSSFSELQDIPLEVAKKGKKAKVSTESPTTDEPEKPLTDDSRPVAGMRFEEPPVKIPAENTPSALILHDAARQAEVAERFEKADAHGEVRKDWDKVKNNPDNQTDPAPPGNTKSSKAKKGEAAEPAPDAQLSDKEAMDMMLYGEKGAPKEAK